MKMKRLFTLVLSLMMILSLSAPASAIDGENVYTKEEISSINEVNVAKYAKSFVETIDSTADVTAGNVLTMYSENENISGYCVDILEDGYPNGYVVVKFSDNNGWNDYLRYINFNGYDYTRKDGWSFSVSK